MHITNAPLPAATLALQSTKPVMQAWTMGQLLKATVITPVQQGRVVLVIGGSRMEAETNSPLRPGQTLTVRVERRADPTLLRVVDRRSEAPAVQTRALRGALPRQTPLPPLLANLSVLAKAPQQVAHEAAPRWGQLAREILSSLPQAKDVARPEGLRQALRDSGVFFESRVSQAALAHTPFPSQDLKAGLLRLAGLLARTPPTAVTPGPGGGTAAGSPPATVRAETGPAVDRARPQTPATPQPEAISAAPPPQRGTPPRPQPSLPASLLGLGAPEKVAAEMRGQVEGTIARVQLQQLSSLPAEDGTRLVWSAELPVRDSERVDLWALRIEEEEPAREPGDSARWSVSLAFDLQDLGPVHARVVLQGERISTSFWVEQPATAAIFEAHKESLRASLEEAGLAVGNILCVQGNPPKPDDSGTSPPLIELEA
jgi:hypothetical protein